MKTIPTTWNSSLVLRNYRWFCLILLILLSSTLSGCFVFRWFKSVPPVPPIVDVEVISATSKVLVRSTAKSEVSSLESHKVVHQFGATEKCKITVSHSQFVIDGKAVQSNSLKIMSPESPYLQVNGRSYRGELLLFLVGRLQVKVVNRVPLEQYLQGVVPREMSSSWPMEALKAQAVAARTYAIYQLMHRKYGGYDLKSTVESQVYGGVHAETERTNRAVDDTRDEVMIYQKELVAAYFHSTCGGRTEDDVYLWGGDDLPYLRSVKDKYCRLSPHYSWKTQLTRKELKKRLENAGYSPGKIYWVKVKKSNTKRVKRVVIKGTKKKLYLKDTQFRRVWGSSKFKSRFYKIKNRARGIVVKGHGWGHGVGLCQWGARGMAEAGRGYKSILSHYYNGPWFKHIKVVPYKKIKKLKVFLGSHAKR